MPNDGFPTAVNGTLPTKSVFLTKGQDKTIDRYVSDDDGGGGTVKFGTQGGAPQSAGGAKGARARGTSQGGIMRSAMIKSQVNAGPQDPPGAAANELSLTLKKTRDR